MTPHAAARLLRNLSPAQARVLFCLADNEEFMPFGNDIVPGRSLVHRGFAERTNQSWMLRITPAVRDAARILRKLVDLARRAERRPGGIAMADVFDGEADAEAWRRLWEEARRLVYETS